VLNFFVQSALQAAPFSGQFSLQVQAFHQFRAVLDRKVCLNFHFIIGDYASDTGTVVEIILVGAMCSC
jgi:hypothetical protein